MASLPEHVVARLRRKAPDDGHVVQNSTPVLSFGNPAAVVATIGLNPSAREFLGKNSQELDENHRRLQTMKSLGVSDLGTASDAILARVVHACNNYFAQNPYSSWFNQLLPILKRVGACYYDGSACHLDLVQWATDRPWSKIPGKVRARLLAEDVPFLRTQLKTGSFKLVLLNGSGVTEHFGTAFGMPLSQVGIVTGASVSSRVLAGRLPWGTRVIGWSVNIQSTPGAADDSLLIGRLADRVAELTMELALTAE